MARPTRTLNPLPFQDLEPHRFEDLVRGLLYTFRHWLKLEPTGRGGSDDGFDVRGWAAPDFISDSTVLDDDDAARDFLSDSELWLVLFTRVKDKRPTKIFQYLETH